MYYLYQRERRGQEMFYRRKNQISLFGSKSGLIPSMLRGVLNPAQNEPFRWAISLDAELPKQHGPESAVVIDLKPHSRKEIALLELRSVWGYSCDNWTPILMKMRGLLVDRERRQFDKAEFTPMDEVEHPVIYTFLHLNGSIEEGKLTGKWTTPGPSSTNSALLWPGVMLYFMECIQKV